MSDKKGEERNAMEERAYRERRWLGIEPVTPTEAAADFLRSLKDPLLNAIGLVSGVSGGALIGYGVATVAFRGDFTALAIGGALFGLAYAIAKRPPTMSY